MIGKTNGFFSYRCISNGSLTNSSNSRSAKDILNDANKLERQKHQQHQQITYTHKSKDISSSPSTSSSKSLNNSPPEKPTFSFRSFLQTIGLVSPKSSQQLALSRLQNAKEIFNLPEFQNCSEREKTLIHLLASTNERIARLGIISVLSILLIALIAMDSDSRQTALRTEMAWLQRELALTRSQNGLNKIDRSKIIGPPPQKDSSVWNFIWPF